MDAYAVLGLRPSSSKDEIKARYRELARRWHPDKNKDPGAATKMREINQAYEQLMSGHPQYYARPGKTQYRQSTRDPFGFAHDSDFADAMRYAYEAMGMKGGPFHESESRASQKKCPHCNGKGWIPA